ncbi:MAG: SET domain-containing protein [Leptospiraceae bacterium]|nr:SET domain-containing protein [Leptospiraceae bacterium]
MNLFQFILLLFMISCTSSVSKSSDFNVTSYREKDLQVLKSKIPGAGKGVFAKVDLPMGEVLGPYTGRFISEAEHIKLAQKGEWQYLMGLEDCVSKYTNGFTVIDGRYGSIMTIINYAPKEFQNVRYHKICEPPFVQIVTTKPIKAGAELYVDYGPDYIYDFMEYPEVKKYFANKPKN